MNILIVDDDSTNRKLLSAVLQAEDMNTLEAQDGRQAFAILEHEKVDAVISDILMPNMDGYQLCQEVRRSERFKNVPFIHYTSTYTTPADRKLSESVGADKYLAKPAPSHLLLAMLRELVTEKKPRAARADPLPDEVVMREYNAALVHKLEERNAELENARADLSKLNEELEKRVQQRTAQLEAANKELEAFSYSISHDLRAPLRAMGGFSRILEEETSGKLYPEARKALQRIQENAVKMGQLIDGLLDFSRLNWVPLTKKKVSPSDIARAVFEDLRPEIAGRRVEMEITGLPACAGDPKLLREVFVNLLSNALKYTGGRDPAVIKVGWRKENDDCVYYVQDNGAGFDMAHAGKLFRVFQRLHSANQFEGTGVGLAIVQRIIHRHGGRVWAEAEVNHGATFYFTLGDSHPPSHEAVAQPRRNQVEAGHG